MKKAFDKLSESARVYLTCAIIWLTTGFGYDDETLLMLGTIFLLVGAFEVAKDYLKPQTS